MKYQVATGRPKPLGTAYVGEGINFAIFSQHATAITLELFDSAEAEVPMISIPLDPVRNRTGDIWHIWVEGIKSGQLYGYRADGPYSPQHGHRYNRFKLLQDPYARVLVGEYSPHSTSILSYAPGSNARTCELNDANSAAHVPKCMVWHEPFDWQGVRVDERLPYKM